MPVHEPGRLVFVQQLIEAHKALVGAVGAVVQAAGRGMSEQDVDAAHLVRLQPEFACPAAHGRLGVLVGIFLVVAETPAQPHDAQPVPHEHLIIHTDAAARLIAPVASVVVAVDIQNGHGREIGQILQVLFRQVSAGEDQVDPLQLFPGIVIPQGLGRDI